MSLRYVSQAVLLSAFLPVSAQLPGDALFDTDQVIEMRFTFDEPDFWLQLLMDHNAGGEISRPVALQITDNTGTHTLDSVGVRLKGNSSFDFYPTDKKPLKLDFNEFESGQDYHGLKKLNLSNCWSDPSFLREKVFFDICRGEGVLAPRMCFADVYLNDVHWGLYGVIEQVDKTFLDRWLGDNDGNLFKAGDNYTPDGGGLGQEADLKHYGSTAGDYTGRYELKTNETQNDWSDLIELLDVIDNASNTEFAAQMPQRTEWSALLRSLALDNLFGNMDAYYGTARNYYLYHDSTSLKWNWIHWDANMSFGRYVPQWVTDVAALPATYNSPGRRLLQRVMGNTALRQAYLNEYCAVFEHFSNAELDPHINALRDLIQPFVYADNNKEYQSIHFDLNIEETVTAQSGQWWNTIPGLKSFIAERRANLLSSSLDCTTAALTEEEKELFAAFPNPTDGEVQLRLPSDVRASDIQVNDALGRAVSAPISLTMIDLSHLPTGAYTVIVNTEKAQARAVVVKR